MIDSTQLGYPEGPVGNETPANQPNPPADPTAELVQVSQDGIPAGNEALNESIPVSPLDLSTVAMAHQESVSHFDAVGLATAYTDAVNQAAMDAGYCELEPENLDDAGPEPTTD